MINTSFKKTKNRIKNQYQTVWLDYTTGNEGSQLDILTSINNKLNKMEGDK